MKVELEFFKLKIVGRYGVVKYILNGHLILIPEKEEKNCDVFNTHTQFNTHTHTVTERTVFLTPKSAE